MDFRMQLPSQYRRKLLAAPESRYLVINICNAESKVWSSWKKKFSCSRGQANREKEEGKSTNLHRAKSTKKQQQMFKSQMWNPRPWPWIIWRWNMLPFGRFKISSSTLYKSTRLFCAQDNPFTSSHGAPFTGYPCFLTMAEFSKDANFIKGHLPSVPLERLFRISTPSRS